MNIFKRLERFVAKTFKTTIEIFFEALKMSPNAQGYVSGSVTELLLKNKLEVEGFEVKRIKEKWEGRKHPNHYGDFYFRRPNEFWFVLESKGVKSNSEKWHKLYNYNNLRNFLYTHRDKIGWIIPTEPAEPQIINWLKVELPELNEKTPDLYEYEEVQKYVLPKRETAKSKAIALLKPFSREEIQDKIHKRLDYVMSKVRILETHFVSGVSTSNERTQATPRKDEFNLISIDIFLRYSEHKFLFANPKQLASSGDDENHLQQNYIMGFIFPQPNGEPNINLSEEWTDNFKEAFYSLSNEEAINEADMQVDNRNLSIEE
nr:hypothetical protein [uncultured Capnocytophaga sp.]